jgi:hypothetical protein
MRQQRITTLLVIKDLLRQKSLHAMTKRPECRHAVQQDETQIFTEGG